MAEKWRELTFASLAVQKAGSVANETFGRGRVLAIHHMGIPTMLLAIKLLDISLVLFFCFLFKLFSLASSPPINAFWARAIIGGGFSWRSLLANFKMFISSSL